MTKNSTIKGLFASDIYRPIEEVIKVDQSDEAILRDEIKEYVATDAIRRHYTNIFEVYRETPNKPREGVAVWVSGFFGSGKSSFAKMLGLAISNRSVQGKGAAELFSEHVGDPKISVLLKTISEKIPTHAVIFDVSTDRGIRSGNQTLTEIMYGLFLQSLGYAKNLDLSELEITLEEQGKLAEFEREYHRLFKKEWSNEKGKVTFALSEASRVLHSLDPATYPAADSWVRAVKDKADITPGKLAERANELMRRRKPNHHVVFVVDEVGQFVARDVQKMLDLQAIVQNLGMKGRGKQWIVVTSQEKLGELVSGLDDTKIELARLMDRFPLQVHLEPSDIAEVTSRRVLMKNAPAEGALGKLFDENRGRLTDHTRLSALVKLPELTRAHFIDLYPLLPYQIDLIIDIVSGLRTQGGASKQVGGANRKIIKLAQQLLVHPTVNLAEQPVGALVTLDRVYDLVEGDISSEVRAKISAIPKTLEHPLAQSVAKVICLLQYVKTVERSETNIAAALHPAVGAESQLASVKEALRELEKTHNVRQGEGGYRIPTPAEDDWERVRNGLNPRPADVHRLHSDVLAAFWQPAPSYTLEDTKAFKAGLAIHGRDVVEGDLTFQVHFADDASALETLAADLRARSQLERNQVFWAVGRNDTIDRETVELFRSQEMLKKRERDARGDEAGLVNEERVRARRYQDELRRHLKAACLSGHVYFRGHDRSPSDRTTEVSKAAADIMAHVLPDVFERFAEAAAKPAEVKRGLDALLVAENLQGLPSVFGNLGLLRDEKGRTVFNTEANPLAEVLQRIEARANYGEAATGKSLADEYAKEPYGWEFDAVKLIVLSLLRAGAIEATSKGQTIETATGVEARDTFTNNNVFKQASFRPKKGIEFAELVKASEAFQETFGSTVKELSAAAIVTELRGELLRHEDTVLRAHGLLLRERLPGGGVLQAALDQMKGIMRGSEDNAIATFNTAHRPIKEAIRRAGELEQNLTEPRLHDLRRAREALERFWPFLSREADLPEGLSAKATSLQDLLERETFYRELPAIDQHARAIEKEYERRYQAAVSSRTSAYASALQELATTPGWNDLTEDQRKAISTPLEQAKKAPVESTSIPQLISEREACRPRLLAAVTEVRRILDGERIATVRLDRYFSGGVETEEQLEAALQGIREECARLIGAGKKVIIE